MQVLYRDSVIGPPRWRYCYVDRLLYQLSKATGVVLVIDFTNIDWNLISSKGLVRRGRLCEVYTSEFLETVCG